MANNTKNEELRSTILILAPFSIVALISDVTYKNFGSMFTGPDAWVGIVWAVLHVAMIAMWYVVVKHWQDPNKNFFRVVLFIVSVGAAALTLGHRGGWLENKQVIEDSRPK